MCVCAINYSCTAILYGRDLTCGHHSKPSIKSVIGCRLNKVVSGVTEIIKDTASKCFKLKESRSHKSKMSKRRKVKWFDRSLSEMKKQLERTAYMFKKHPKDPVVRGRYFSIKKSFKTLIRQKENDFRNKVLKQIALMESKNPNKFWNMVNELRTTKQSNYIDNIEPKKMVFLV